MTFPKPLLPRCSDPLKFSSVSVILVGDVALQCPLLKSVETEETIGYFDSRRSRCPLMLGDSRIDVRLVIDKGHREIKE